MTMDWRIWIIDYKQAFRSNKHLEHPETLMRCDSSLRMLNNDALRLKLGKYLSTEQIEALEVRRELIVKHFAEQIANKGESAVLYDLPPGR
jgi:hypothetical protein